MTSFKARWLVLVEQSFLGLLWRYYRASRIRLETRCKIAIVKQRPAGQRPLANYSNYIDCPTVSVFVVKEMFLYNKHEKIASGYLILEVILYFITSGNHNSSRKLFCNDMKRLSFSFYLLSHPNIKYLE